MNTTTKIQYIYGDAAAKAALPITEGTVSAQSHALGMRCAEPLIIMLDSLEKYAASYRKRFGSPLAEDYVLGESWVRALKGVRELLNGDGAVAMSMARVLDSKDNGACKAMFWAALETAGFTEETAGL